MRRALTLLACAGALLAAGCGSGDDEGDPIPQDLAAEMQNQLDHIQGQIENGTLGACQDILSPENTFATLQDVAGRVPDSVGEDVRDALRQSIERLGELVEERCTELEREESTQTETTEEPEPEPEQPTETEEIPTETTEEPPPEEEPEEPSEEDPSQGPGNGNGNGPPSGGTPPSGGVPAPGDNG